MSNSGIPLVEAYRPKHFEDIVMNTTKYLILNI